MWKQWSIPPVAQDPSRTQEEQGIHDLPFQGPQPESPLITPWFLVQVNGTHLVENRCMFLNKDCADLALDYGGSSAGPHAEPFSLDHGRRIVLLFTIPQYTIPIPPPFRTTCLTTGNLVGGIRIRR